MYKDLENRKKILIDYLKKNPNATYNQIRIDTKIKVERVYKSMKDAYKDAEIKFTKNLCKRNREEQKRDVINFIKKNPECTVLEIWDATKVTIPRVFGSIINAYTAAGIEYPKRKVKDGIRNPLVIKRCKKYEKKIYNLLKDFGDFEPQIKTKRGIADGLLKYKGEIFVVEIKDFRSRNNITMFNIKQLIRYMKDLGYKKGLIVCPKESFPKRKNTRNVYIDNFSISILSEEDIINGGLG